MKKRIVSIILSVMMAGFVFGCGKAQPQSPQAASENETAATIDSTSENAETGSAAEKEDEKQAENEQDEITQEEPQEETEQEAVTTGGTPWIDSEIKENISADTKTDPKDDFYLYANKDWILSNDIPEGYRIWGRYDERELQVKKQCIALLKDESVKGHDAEVVRTYNKLLLDWDARNKAGYSDI